MGPCRLSTGGGATQSVVQAILPAAGFLAVPLADLRKAMIGYSASALPICARKQADLQSAAGCNSYQPAVELTIGHQIRARMLL